MLWVKVLDSIIMQPDLYGRGWDEWTWLRWMDMCRRTWAQCTRTDPPLVIAEWINFTHSVRSASEMMKEVVSSQSNSRNTIPSCDLALSTASCWDKWHTVYFFRKKKEGKTQICDTQTINGPYSHVSFPGRCAQSFPDCLHYILAAIICLLCHNVKTYPILWPKYLKSFCSIDNVSDSLLPQKVSVHDRLEPTMVQPPHLGWWVLSPR